MYEQLNDVRTDPKALVINGARRLARLLRAAAGFAAFWGAFAGVIVALKGLLPGFYGVLVSLSLGSDEIFGIEIVLIMCAVVIALDGIRRSLVTAVRTVTLVTRQRRRSS
jgi:hypothetical protein